MRLIVLAKSPASGRSKTRLCPPCTPAQAARVAEAALHDTLDACRGTRADDLVIALDGPVREWAQGFRIIRQRGDGLDERISSAFADAGPEREGTLLIGMDTPQVTSATLDAAMGRLLEPGVSGVLGPASDGGWWAMGLRDPEPEYVVGVPMSSPHTLARQRERWDRLGVARAELCTLTDIDTFQDALGVAASIPSSRTAAVVEALAERMVVATW
ncbi:MAG: DUF2064 domain-containing protein [Actinomycetota bacterium]